MPPLTRPKSDAEIFAALADRISRIIGIDLGDKQSSLVHSRISRHLRSLGGITPQAYWDYFHAHEAEEIQSLISLLTTHHTFFFREMNQFRHIQRELKTLVETVRKSGRSTIDIWSAASSHGHEGYSIAMLLEYHLAALNTPVSYRILFSDVDANSIEISRSGVYANRELNQIEMHYRANFWTVGRGSAEGYSKVRKAVKERCEFVTKNLLDVKAQPNSRKFDLIFCRNVFIYFNPEQIRQMSLGLISHLHPHGQMFIGASESLVDLRLPLAHLGNSIYALKPDAPRS